MARALPDGCQVVSKPEDGISATRPGSLSAMSELYLEMQLFKAGLV